MTNSVGILGDWLAIEKGQTYDSKLAGKPGPFLIGMGVFDPSGGFREHKLRTYAGAVRSEAKAPPGTVLVATTDMGQKVRILGRSATVPDWIGEYGVVSADIGIVHWRTTDVLTKKFAYWTIRTDAFRNYCVRHATGTTVRRVRPKDIQAFPIDGLRVPLTKSLAEVLETLENMIELNRQLSRTLQEIAQAIFKSWFIDFDGHDDLVESELGMIPKGWEEGGALSQLAYLENRTIKPMDEPERIWIHHSIPAYDDGRVPAGSSIKSNKFAVPTDSILLSKLNPRFPRIWMPDDWGEATICSTDERLDRT